MQQYYVPLPTNSVVARLNDLSQRLGWGRLSFTSLADDELKHRTTRPWVWLWWESERKYRMQFIVSTCFIDIHRSQVAKAKDAYDWLDLVVVGPYPIKVGRLSIFLPDRRSIAKLADALSPIFHVSHFKTKRARSELLQRYPNFNLECPSRDPLRVYHLVNGQIAINKRGDKVKSQSRPAKNS